jgi:hypothetical protein
MVTMIDLHAPDFLMLMETPMLPHHGALTKALSRKRYKIHFHQVNAQDILPETRLLAHTTHNGEGCWVAYNKHTPWTATIRPLPLPGNCPRATPCTVELALTSGAKSAITACYPPQDEDSHAQTCMALTLLTPNLPHHIQILGGDLQGNRLDPNAKDANVRKLSHTR